MVKEDFVDKFPDVKIQQFETKVVLSHSEVIKLVEEAMTSLGMGLIHMERRGRKITCFTSDKMKNALDKMVKGFTVIEPNTGEEGVVLSDKPFLNCGEYCVRVEFPGEEFIYSCEYFID